MQILRARSLCLMNGIQSNHFFFVSRNYGANDRAFSLETIRSPKELERLFISYQSLRLIQLNVP